MKDGTASGGGIFASRRVELPGGVGGGGGGGGGETAWAKAGGGEGEGEKGWMGEKIINWMREMKRSKRIIGLKP